MVSSNPENTISRSPSLRICKIGVHHRGTNPFWSPEKTPSLGGFHIQLKKTPSSWPPSSALIFAGRRRCTCSELALAPTRPQTDSPSPHLVHQAHLVQPPDPYRRQSEFSPFFELHRCHRGILKPLCSSECVLHLHCSSTVSPSRAW
jgi:hypothetical protein